jgi:hypothetical protein
VGGLHSERLLHWAVLFTVSAPRLGGGYETGVLIEVFEGYKKNIKKKESRSSGDDVSTVHL